MNQAHQSTRGNYRLRTTMARASRTSADEILSLRTLDDMLSLQDLPLFRVPPNSLRLALPQFSDFENGERSQRLDRFYSACACEIGSPLMIASIVFWVALALIGPNRSETTQLSVSRSRRGHSVSQRGLRIRSSASKLTGYVSIAQWNSWGMTW